MTSLIRERRGANTKDIFEQSLQQVRGEKVTRLEQMLARKLAESVTQMLSRAPYGRRSQVPG